MLQNNRLSKNNKGMSLVEVIALIAVLSVVVAAVVGFMITGSKMSVNVSGKAGASIKEQTAVEFINKTILKYGEEIAVVPMEDNADDGTNDDQNCALHIKLSERNYALLITEDGKVVYQTYVIEEGDVVTQLNSTELCSGEVRFEMDSTNNTVTYYLNNAKHVVHLRVAAISNSSDVGGMI